MLKWSFVFLLISLIAGALGFTGVAGTASVIAKTLFFVFLGIWVAIIAVGALILKR